MFQLKLKKELALNTYDNKGLLAEMVSRINISMGNHTFNERNTDSSKTVPVLIYKSKRRLTASSEKKVSLWLQQRFVKNKSKCIAKNRIILLTPII
jgi:hypothetical protein